MVVGKIVAGFASSHAFALAEPETWDARRAQNRERLLQRLGAAPPDQPQVAEETLERNVRRYNRVRSGLDRLHDELMAKRPEVVLLVGDDQDEHFHEDHMPQFLI